MAASAAVSMQHGAALRAYAQATASERCIASLCSELFERLTPCESRAAQLLRRGIEPWLAGSVRGSWFRMREAWRDHWDGVTGVERVRARELERGWEWRRRTVRVSAWAKWHGGDLQGYIGNHAALIRKENRGWYAGEAWSEERWARLHEIDLLEWQGKDKQQTVIITVFWKELSPHSSNNWHFLHRFPPPFRRILADSNVHIW